MEVNENIIFLGCEDGGLRLLKMGMEGHLDHQPHLFPSLNGVHAPAVTCIHVVSLMDPDKNKGYATNFLCTTGSKDGIISAFFVTMLK